ncbi:MAG: DUF4397 domain-containing protein [Pseudomonadota bacterium]
MADRCITRLLALLAVVGLAACTGNTPDDPPNGSIRFVHVAPSLGPTDFLIEELRRGPASNYLGATDTFSIDSGPFDVNVEIADPAAATGNIRVLSQQISIVANSELLLALFDDGPSLAFTEYQLPLDVIAEGESELVVLHAAQGAGPIDVYIEADGTDLAGATPRASLAVKEIGTPFTIPVSDVRVTATAPGDPTTILYQSLVFPTPNATSSVVAFFASAGTASSPLRISILDRQSTVAGELNDDSAPASLRLINGGVPLGPIDLFAAGDFTAPVHAAVQPREIRDYEDIPAGATQIQVTPAGNPGVIELDNVPNFLGGVLTTQLVVGSPGDASSALYVENNRGNSSRVNFRFRSAASSFPQIDVYILEPGTDFTDDDIGPVARGLAVAGQELTATALADDYEITLVENDGDVDTDDTTVIAGPIPVTWENGRVYEVLIFDSDTAGQVDVQIADVTAPLP